MTDEEKDQYFTDLWMGAIRSIYKNEFLRPPKSGSAGNKHLLKARRICDEMGGDYSDYIKCHLLALQYVNVKPQPFHLATDNAKKRFHRYQIKYNKWIRPLFRVDGESFIVTETNKIYQTREVELASSVDPRAHHILQLLEVPYNEIPESSKEEIYFEAAYLEAKARFNGRPLPASFRDFKRRVTDDVRKEQEPQSEEVESVQPLAPVPTEGLCSSGTS
jgi:hypothetical protein